MIWRGPTISPVVAIKGGMPAKSNDCAEPLPLDGARVT